MAFITLDDFITDTTINLDQTAPSIAMLSDGRFVVTWASLDTAPTQTSGRASSTRMERPPPSTARPMIFLVSTTNVDTQQTPSVSALANGRWASRNGTDFDIRGALFNADGTRAAING
jgi:hypothetical protein